MTSDEFEQLPAGYKQDGYMKVADPYGYFSGTDSIVVNLETGELVHWSHAWYKTEQKTIWNSDGTDGPVLICTPPKDRR